MLIGSYIAISEPLVVQDLMVPQIVRGAPVSVPLASTVSMVGIKARRDSLGAVGLRALKRTRLIILALVCRPRLVKV
jgi:hypothetical protein